MATPSKRFSEPKDPLWDDPETRKKYEQYLENHKRRLKRLEYESSDRFLESPPPWPKED